MLTLNQILLKYEGTLQIDYVDREAQRIIDNAVKRMENDLNVRIDKPLPELMTEQGLISNNVTILVNQLETTSTDLAYFIHVSMFNQEIPVHLADVNYLGYDAEKVVVALKYLQVKKLYHKRGKTIFASFISALNSLKMCDIKRLFIILATLERLGLDEQVGVVASLLYLGGSR